MLDYFILRIRPVVTLAVSYVYNKEDLLSSEAGSVQARYCKIQ